MGLNQTGSSRKDRWECQEQAANTGSVDLRDHPGDNANGAAEYEAQNPLVRFDSLDSGEAYMDDHGYRATHQPANDKANQTGIKAIVVVRAWVR